MAPLRNYVACAEPRATYAAMVTRMDQHVGRILEQLAKLGLEQNTMVMFASDNGPAAPDVGADAEFFGSAVGARGLKGDVYEGGIRIPLVVRWPGHVKAGATSDWVTALWDFLPTAAEVAGVGRGVEKVMTDGVSIVPTLTGSGRQQEREFLYWEIPMKGQQRAIRKGSWKAVQIGIKGNASAPVELYDLASDPGENKNVAADHPEMVEQLRGLMDHARTPCQKAEWNW